jgi:predicted enzyme related to lactoylglutathione lyase
MAYRYATELNMRLLVSHPAVCPSISRVILYVKDIQTVAAFYEMIFGMKPIESTEAGWLELESPSGGCLVALHKASKAQKSGAAAKLVFGVRNVRAFKEEAALRGLQFGPVHVVRAGLGHEYANSKDPAGNSISISSRGMKALPQQLRAEATSS